ncbi:MAG TPA: ADP-ribosylglycohydrolase family protein [Phycisphaerae bacterium]|nr:ADP-ribosylglycohydrolase family protein [Phycisphaerae bacterium]HRW54787.1 ADP-ribosylglycohydrolase family protein [Phycisphaerae bacterium]
MSDSKLESARILSALLGHAVGDALGVPVEFALRAERLRDPVTEMRGFGTHHQPPGTWSDDTSLTLCTAEALCDGFDLARIGALFSKWYFDNHWTPHGKVFDVGITTRDAIVNLKNGVQPTLAGPNDTYNNGNGSLMRILPIAIYFAHDSAERRRECAMMASCLTHGHIRSQLACAFYSEVAARLLRDEDYAEALSATQRMFRAIIDERHLEEAISFHPILDADLPDHDPGEISGSGYVLHCLRASLWCVARSQSYEEATLMAVNLGDDTDTTAAVTGGLAALKFGADSVPQRWIDALARRDDVVGLYARFADEVVRLARP